MEISTQIIAVLDDLCRRFGIVIDWTNETVLPYIKELAEKYIDFEVETSLFWIIFSASVTVLLWILYGVFNLLSLDGPGVIFGVLGAVGIIISVLIIGCNIYDIITCNTFPEKMLFEEIKSLIQNNGGY